MEQYNDNSSILYERLYDSVTGNPIIIPTTEVQECNNHGIITLSLIPNESEGLEFPELNNMHEVYNAEDVVGENDFYCNYKRGDVYLHESKWHKKHKISYKGEGISFIGANRVYTQRDKNGNVVQTLDYIIEKGWEAIESLLIIGSAIQVLYRLEEDIANGNELHTNLQSDISTGQPLHTQLRKDINDANTFKDQLNEDVADGKILDESLKVQNPRAEQNLANLNKAMTDCADDIANITKTDNGVAIVTTANWGTADSEGFYHCTVTHTANSKDLNLNIFDYTNNVQGESVMVTVTPLTDTTFKVSSIENTPIKIVFASGYYGGYTSANTQQAINSLGTEKQNKTDNLLQTTSKVIPLAINEVKSSLEQSSNNIDYTQINLKNPQVEISKQPILVFIDDDCRIETYTYWHRLAKEKNVKISLACIPEWIENGSATTSVPVGANVVTKEQLKEMYDYGHDILCHGWNSLSIKDFLNSPSDLKKQLVNSKEWIKSNGFTRNNAYNYFVYPQGLQGTKDEQLEVKTEVRKYYNYGINSFTTEKNVSGVFDSFNIPRVTADNTTSAYLISELDKVIANKGMMIVLSHSWHAVDQDNSNYSTWSSRYSALIDYAKSNNVSILPFSEAIKIKGNAISIGEYTSPNSFYINNDGSVSCTMDYSKDSSFMDKPITSYNYGENISIVQSKDDVFLGVGGTLITYRIQAKYLSYQLYIPCDSNDIYKRIYNDSTNSWYYFELITNRKRSCFAYSSGDVSIPNTNTFTIIPFNIKQLDEFGGYNPSEYTFTCKEKGIYNVEFVLTSKITLSSITDITISVFKNNIEIARMYVDSKQANSNFCIRNNTNLRLNVNDYIDIRIKSNQNLTLAGTGAYCGLTIVK